MSELRVEQVSEFDGYGSWFAVFRDRRRIPIRFKADSAEQALEMAQRWERRQNALQHARENLQALHERKRRYER